MATKNELKREIGKKVEEDIKLEVISKKNQREGLCKDCIRAENCTLSHNTKDVIWDCEDYDNQEVVTQESFPTSANVFKKEAKPKTAVKSNPGLCAYCAYKDSCSLKSVEGGIWHCAEYA